MGLQTDGAGEWATEATAERDAPGALGAGEGEEERGGKAVGCRSTTAAAWASRGTCRWAHDNGRWHRRGDRKARAGSGDGGAAFTRQAAYRPNASVHGNAPTMQVDAWEGAQVSARGSTQRQEDRESAVAERERRRPQERVLASVAAPSR